MNLYRTYRKKMAGNCRRDSSSPAFSSIHSHLPELQKGLEVTATGVREQVGEHLLCATEPRHVSDVGGRHKRTPAATWGKA